MIAVHDHHEGHKMSARDELAEAIDNNFEVDDYSPTFNEAGEITGSNVADAIRALGYRKPRTITTAEEIRELPALTVVVYDDMENGGLLQTYVVPDDGTVMFKDCGEFHLMTFGGDYVDAKDMPLPLTVVYEVGA